MWDINLNKTLGNVRVSSLWFDQLKIEYLQIFAGFLYGCRCQNVYNFLHRDSIYIKIDYKNTQFCEDEVFEMFYLLWSRSTCLTD